MSQPQPEVTATAVAEPKADPSRHGVSLGLMFVITTFAAVLVAGIAPVGQQLVLGRVGLLPLAIALVCGLLGGALLGLILGMHRYARVLGALLCSLVGAGLGSLVSPMVLLPANLLPLVAMAMFVGSLLMIGVAFIMRPGRR